ncbi:hypothetical protein WR25_06756 [Diploscapter pachys]|uniref:Protein SYS1 homolog n=1 Tax=Diploscapter pachys TaxID=2018661 RepID=A0A2A2K9R0_9BILA|nr:hypothetical protein WR25_06756 [Diploscapter pachys]
MSSFRTFIWDPFLLLGQMACLQSVFYTAQSILMVLYSVTGYEPYLSHIFSFQMLRSSAVIQLLSVLLCSYALSMIVQRAKHCLDFACTLHFFHLLICCLYNQAFPTSLSWWTIQAGIIYTFLI